MKFRVICPYCEHTVTAKRKGAAKLAKHIQDEHPEHSQQELYERGIQNVDGSYVESGRLFSAEGIGRRPAIDDTFTGGETP